MNKITQIVAVSAILGLSACSEYKSPITEVPNGSVYTLDENQTIGYPVDDGSNVQIVNVSNGSYFVSCDGSDTCNIHIGDESETTNNTSTSSSSSSSTTNNATTNNESNSSEVEDTNTTTP